MKTARIPDTRYVEVDCYAADPRQGHVLDPGFHRVHPGELVAGARVVFQPPDQGSYATLWLDFTNAGDPQGHLTGAVLLDREAALDIAAVCRALRNNPDGIGQMEIYVHDDGEDYYGHYGDDQPPDTQRLVHVGRLGSGDPLVYLRLDLIETHGIAPTVWLDRDQLREVGNTASDLAGEM